MKKKHTEYKAAVGIRGDMEYCPLPFTLDSYWTCAPNCLHCFARRLNRTWGEDFRIADPEAVKKRLSTATGKSPLHEAIRQRKTIRFGNRSDPFQKWELKYKVSTKILKFLIAEKWDCVIQTKHPTNVLELVGPSKYYQLMPIITVGMEADWELFEKKKTENPVSRLNAVQRVLKKGYSAGVNGEPFIPGYHTVKQFRDMMKLLKSKGIPSFNTYNLHMNDMVAKNLHGIGLDIEKIWIMNQDENWKNILRKLIDLAKKYDIILGCPDFVNSGWNDVQQSNTCCGLNVKNPCTYNSHHFKLAVQKGKNPNDCWDEVGTRSIGQRVINEKSDKFYTLYDIGEG